MDRSVKKVDPTTEQALGEIVERIDQLETSLGVMVDAKLAAHDYLKSRPGFRGHIPGSDPATIRALREGTSRQEAKNRNLGEQYGMRPDAFENDSRLVTEEPPESRVFVCDEWTLERNHQGRSTLSALVRLPGTLNVRGARIEVHVVAGKPKPEPYRWKPCPRWYDLHPETKEYIRDLEREVGRRK